MRLPPKRPGADPRAALPLWPPLLAARGPGGRSAPHAHHAMHLVLRTTGVLRARAGASAAWIEGAGVVTAADAVHEIDARGGEVLLVFLDPESDAGAALAGALEGPVRALAPDDRDALLAGGADPLGLMAGGGDAFIARAAQRLGARSAVQARRAVHPRVRKLLRLLAAADPGEREREPSLDALAASVGLSPGRLMHVFTTSLGIPLRPYLAWLRIQRAAGALVAGASIADAAAGAGFADAAHLSRTFRRMFGVPPSQMRPAG
jgi:AraC-like DNA-binding protein